MRGLLISSKGNDFIRFLWKKWQADKREYVFYHCINLIKKNSRCAINIKINNTLLQGLRHSLIIQQTMNIPIPRQ